MSKICKIISQEIEGYVNGEIELSEGVLYSQYKIVKRISLYQNQTYVTGKTDSQGRYKFWFDIISARVNSEIKNIDFDTKDVRIYGEPIDKLATFLSNMYLKIWLKETNQGEDINNSIETFSAWGNVVWKKIKNDYEEVDLKNFYLTNPTAKSLDDTDCIERHILSQSDLRAKNDIWNNVDQVIKTCGNDFFSATEKSTDIETTNKVYEIYERNGEVSEKDLFEAQGKDGGDEDKFVLAKIIVAGLKKGAESKNTVLFAEEIKDKPYKEAHRGRYEGRWLRKGLYEILFDCQQRANEIGNQIARGLEWSSKQIFRSADKLIIQNALTDMRSGDIIKSNDLAQVETRLQGFDQLMADWNRNIQHANELANSYEVVTGEAMPSGTPFRLGSMQNQNANKLFDFLREKLALSLEEVFNDWIIPKMMKDLRQKTILEISGDENLLNEYNKMLVDAWYINNLLVFPPHSTKEGQTFKELKLEEVSKNKDKMLKIENDFWEGYKPRAKVDISGEGLTLAQDLETISTFIQLETDPMRRAFLLDQAYAKKGILIPPAPVQPEVEQ